MSRTFSTAKGGASAPATTTEGPTPRPGASLAVDPQPFPMIKVPGFPRERITQRHDRYVDPGEGEPGDCLRACLASLLGLGLLDVPHFAAIEREKNHSAIKGVFLDELEPGTGRYDPEEVECDLACTAVESEWQPVEIRGAA